MCVPGDVCGHGEAVPRGGWGDRQTLTSVFFPTSIVYLYSVRRMPKKSHGDPFGALKKIPPCLASAFILSLSALLSVALLLWAEPYRLTTLLLTSPHLNSFITFFSTYILVWCKKIVMKNTGQTSGYNGSVRYFHRI